MQNMIPDSEIHMGHRERMRGKLIHHGGDIFDTYELLEMLLYNVIPVRDTNPIAKRLLNRFGSLDGVFFADAEELMEVDGIGEAAARYIKSVGTLPEIANSYVTLNHPLETFDDIGRFLTEYFAGCFEYKSAMVLFDNSMRVIDVVEVYRNDYDRGNVLAAPFIDTAISFGAAFVALVHNHPYGPLYPTHADLLTNGIILSAFIGAGVKVIDHFLICGNKYIGINDMTHVKREDELVDALELAIEKAESRREEHSDV